MTAAACIFDLDGTLVDSMDVWARIDEVFFRKRGLAVPDGYTEAIAALSFRQTAQYTAKRFLLEDTPEQLMAEWNAMAAEEYAVRVPAKPGALAYLARLAAAGIPMAAATSLPPALYAPLLARTGLGGFFTAVCSCEILGVGKDHPDVYLQAAAALRTPPAACAVYEDLLPALRTAKEAGFLTVGVYDEPSRAQWPQLCAAAHFHLVGFEGATLWL